MRSQEMLMQPLGEVVSADQLAKSSKQSMDENIEHVTALNEEINQAAEVINKLRKRK